MSQAPSPPGHDRRPRIGLAAFVAAVALAVIYLGYLGYLGGAVFREVPAAPVTRPLEQGTAVVLLSGDMGFSVGMGPQIARRLAADGVPVIGVNSLGYFRHRRTPQEVTALLAEAMRRAESRYHADRLVLIGQSYGADMLHVGLAGLPGPERARIALVALVVPERTVEFRASPSEIFSAWEPELDALPTARALGWTPTLCIFGLDEEKSLCPLLAGSPVRLVGLPGGHPLHHDADALYAVIRKAMATFVPKNRP